MRWFRIMPSSFDLLEPGRLERIMRRTAFALPPAVFVVSAVHIVISHFHRNLMLALCANFLFCCQVAWILYRRSKGLEASSFDTSTRPSDNYSRQLQFDFGALIGAASLFLTALLFPFFKSA